MFRYIMPRVICNASFVSDSLEGNDFLAYKRVHGANDRETPSLTSV